MKFLFFNSLKVAFIISVISYGSSSLANGENTLIYRSYHYIETIINAYSKDLTLPTGNFNNVVIKDEINFVSKHSVDSIKAVMQKLADECKILKTDTATNYQREIKVLTEYQNRVLQPAYEKALLQARQAELVPKLASTFAKLPKIGAAAARLAATPEVAAGGTILAVGVTCLNTDVCKNAVNSQLESDRQYVKNINYDTRFSNENNHSGFLTAQPNGAAR